MPKKINKRANGEGTIYYDKAKNIYRAMLVTPAGKRMTKSSKDETIVRDWLNEQRLLIGRNQHIEPTGITVGQWFDTWLETYAKNNTKPRTYDRYCSLLDCAEPIRTIKLTNLVPAHLQKLYNDLSKVYAGNTMKHIHFCISGALKQAVINNLIHINPCINVKTPSARRKEIVLFAANEVQAMLIAAENYPCEPIIMLAYTTGMRLSEILALRWEDVDLRKPTDRIRPTLTVNQTVHRSFSAGLYFSDCKNNSSHRKITLPIETVKALNKYKLKTGRTEGLIFLNSNNGSYDSTSYSRIFKKIEEEANINDKGFHSFRHTHASELLAAGIPIQEVSRRLGHAKISTTLDIYSHCIPTEDERITDKISELLNKTKTQAN